MPDHQHADDRHALPKTSAPAQRALTAAGISSLDDLVEHTEAGIAALHGMGPKALGILRDALATHGLSFKDDDRAR